MFNVETIKTLVPLERYLSHIGRTLKRTGGNMNVDECPLCGHKDCFRLDPKTDLYRCFSCGSGGDVVSLHEALSGKAFPQAIAELGALFGIPEEPDPQRRKPRADTPKPETETPKPEAETPKPETETATTETDTATPGNPKQQNPFSPLLALAVDHYRNAAQTAAPFARYAAIRGLTPELCEAYQLGYADGTLLDALKDKVSIDALLEARLVRKDEKTGRLYDFFNKQVVFPFLSPEGDVVHLKGKGIDALGKSTKRVYQLPLDGRPRPFFGRHITPKEVLYLTEGESDAVAVARTGQTAWSLGGMPSTEQFASIRRLLLRGMKVVLIPDNDQGGERYIELFQRHLRDFCHPPTLRAYRHIKGECAAGLPPAPHKDIDEALREKLLPLENVLLPKPMYPDLKGILNDYYNLLSEDASGLRYNVDIVSRIIFEYFAGFGQFFVVDDADCYLIFRGKQYQVDGNLPFKSLMYSHTGINYAAAQAKPIWEAIKANCYLFARHARGTSWIKTDHVTNTVYFNLCNDRNEIIRIGPDKTDILQNGSNADHVFLFQSPKTLPIEFNANVGMDQGLTALFETLLTGTATPVEWQAYIACLLINSFLIEFAKARGINKFSGHQGSGKTEAAGLLTAILYGQNFVTISSTASDYTDAAINPLTVCDNLEVSSIVEDRKNFLLCVATGITRQKRKAGTDSQNVYEKAVTQVITTSIESFELPELIERTIVVPFSSRYFNRNYPGAIAIEQRIIARRNLVLSAVFRLIAVILTDFDRKKAQWTAHLAQKYPTHAKKRLNEHLACMAIALEAYMEACPLAKDCYISAEKVVHSWILQQDAENDETMQDTNIPLRFLNLLETEWRRGRLGTDYDILADPIWEQQKRALQFETTNDELLSAINLLCRKFALPAPFKSVRHMIVRFQNEEAILKKGGWTVEKSRTVRGKRLYLYTNTPDKTIED